MGGIVGGGGKKGDDAPVPNPQDSIELQRQANRVTQITPFGQTGYGSIDENGNFVLDNTLDVQQTTLAPAQQQLFDTRNAAAQGLLDTAGGFNVGGDIRVNLPMAREIITGGGFGQNVNDFDIRSAGSIESGLPTGADLSALQPNRTAGQIEGALPGINTDFTGEGRRLGDEIFQTGIERLQPQFDRQINRAESDLIARGIPLSSDAASSADGTGALDDVRRSQNDALTQLATQSNLAGNQRQNELFGQELATRQNTYGEQLGLAGLTQGQNQQDFALAEALRGARVGEGLNFAGLESGRRAQQLSENLARFNAANQQNQFLGQFRQQQQGLNQNALALGLQAGTPGANITQAPAVPGIDVQSALNAQQQAQMANANARNSTKGGLLGAAGTIGAAFI